jgi:alkylation response protein AidB-like acyl-CoA dehydrogenase
MNVGAAAGEVLSDAMLAGFAERCAAYDRENRFFQEDFDALKGAGYLTLNVPKELGGRGFSLAEVCREQRRLAYHAAATALGVNMHLYWTGVAADFWRRGDKSLAWMLEEAMAGEVFAAGHAERGNDIAGLLSTSAAERVDGGFRITGHKMFGSMAPVWTRYGLHALWSDAGGGPKIVHAFLPRDSAGFRIVETWDTLGMRGTKSDDVRLEGAFVPDKYVADIVPAGMLDRFVLTIFAWGLLGFANIYYAVAQRAIDVVVPSLKNKTSVALSRSMAYHPEVQHAVAEMALALDPVGPYIDRIAEDWSAGVDHGVLWPAKIISAKYHAVEACWRIVDLAMEVSGGTGMFKTSELERLFRDARCGRFHPANSLLTHEIVGKTALGIDLGEQPRWG